MRHTLFIDINFRFYTVYLFHHGLRKNLLRPSLRVHFSIL